MKILVASQNRKKLVELNRVLTEANVEGITLLSLNDVPAYEQRPETGATFEENALVKAFDGAQASGLPCIADDSGLEVAALNNMPGVLSARWSGVHGDDNANLTLVLKQLSDVFGGRRKARFVSAVTLVLPGGKRGNQGKEPWQVPGVSEQPSRTSQQSFEEITVRGEWQGMIAREPQGQGGFGYDPIFLPLETPGRTAAQLSPLEKDQLSHRGRALRQLVDTLGALQCG